jgi:hypothetical protein
LFDIPKKFHEVGVLFSRRGEKRARIIKSTIEPLFHKEEDDTRLLI